MADLLWPHEVERWQVPLDVHSIEADVRHLGRQSGRLHLQAARAREAQHARLLEQAAALNIVLYNGAPVAAIRGKFRFLNVVRQLGFDAPIGVVVSRLDKADESLEQIERLDRTSPRRFCKPLNGARGNGIYVASSPVDALEFARRADRVYLVENLRRPTGADMRYVFHRGAIELAACADLASWVPPSMRVVIERLGPTVTGDGRSTILQLIDGLSWRSRTDRMKLLLGVGIDRVPARGERVRLIGSGNISHPKFARLPDQALLTHVDGIMLEFIAALEAHIGRPFATLCLDIGLTETGLVIYEQQVKFANPYWYPLGLGLMRQAAVRRAWNNSMMYSGYMARQLWPGMGWDVYG